MTEKVWPAKRARSPQIAHPNCLAACFIFLTKNTLIFFDSQSCIWWAFNNQYLMEGLRNLTSNACTRFFQIVKIHPIFAFHKEMHMCIIRRYCRYYCLVKSACVCVCVCLSVHTASLWDITKPWKYNLQGSYLDVAAPTFSLKTAILQLRLRYTTMWQSYTRANICDLDSTFKYGPIDRSFALLYFTSLNANWFILFSTNVGLALLLALLLCFLEPFLV